MLLVCTNPIHLQTMIHTGYFKKDYFIILLPIKKKSFEDSCASNRACWIHRMTGRPLLEMVFLVVFFPYKVSCKTRTYLYIAYNLPKKSGPPKWKWSRNRQPIPTLLRGMLHAYYKLHNSTNNCYLHSWWTTVALVECLGASGKVRKSAA